MKYFILFIMIGLPVVMAGSDIKREKKIIIFNEAFFNNEAEKAKSNGESNRFILAHSSNIKYYRESFFVANADKTPTSCIRINAVNIKDIKFANNDEYLKFKRNRVDTQLIFVSLANNIPYELTFWYEAKLGKREKRLLEYCLLYAAENNSDAVIDYKEIAQLDQVFILRNFANFENNFIQNTTVYINIASFEKDRQDPLLSNFLEKMLPYSKKNNFDILATLSNNSIDTIADVCNKVYAEQKEYLRYASVLGQIEENADLANLAKILDANWSQRASIIGSIAFANILLKIPYKKIQSNLWQSQETLSKAAQISWGAILALSALNTVGSLSKTIQKGTVPPLPGKAKLVWNTYAIYGTFSNARRIWNWIKGKIYGKPDQKQEPADEQPTQ